MNNQQEDLFAEKELPQSDIKKPDLKYYIPMNRLNLYTVLASGVIPPIQKYSEYENDVQSLLDDKLIISKNGFNFSQLNKIIPESTYNVLIEIDINKIDLNHCYTSKNKKFKKNIDIKECNLFFYNLSIPVTHIKCIHFQSKDNQEDFLARAFENVPTEGIPYKVTAKIFSDETNMLPIEELKNFEAKDYIYTIEDYNLSNSICGAFICCINFLSDNLNSFQNIKKSIDEYLKNNKCTTFVGEDISQFDIDLFELTLSKYMQLDINQGWLPKNILEDISSSLDDKKYAKEDLVKFETWKTITNDILDNKRGIPPLTDEGFIIGRSILLTLLRPSPDDLKKCISSSLEPGDRVLMISSFLIGALFGFETLSNDYKYLNKSLYSFGAQIKSLILNQDSDKYSDADLRIDEEPYGSFGKKIKLIYQDSELIVKDDGGPIELNKVMLLAKSSVYKITLDPDRKFNRLKYTYQFKDGRKQTVYIKVGKPTKAGAKTLRFYSPCLDISIKSNYDSLKKSAISILERSNDPERYCRFAIDKEIMQLVVMRDQIDFSGQSAELDFLKHVAEVADEFEKAFGFDKF